MNIKLKGYQDRFLFSRSRYPAMVTAWATGKTLCGLLRGVNDTKDYPDNLGLIVRNEFTDLRDSTIKDFQNYFGMSVPASKDVVFPNGSIIMFRHGAELEVLQNINLGWFLIEQAEEFETDAQFQMLRGRLRRKGVPHWGGLIANTNGHNWIYRIWKAKDVKVPSEEEIGVLVRETGFSRDEVLDAYDPKHYELIEANTFDNKDNLPPDFLLDLVRLKKESPSHYNRYVLNSWEDLDVDDRVFPYSVIMESVNRHKFMLDNRFIIGCDPAEFGDDETAVYVLDSGKVVEQVFYCKKEPMETAGWLYKIHRQYGCPVVIDNVGIGSGIASRLRELGCHVIAADSRRKSGQPDKYGNLKADMFFAARDRFVNCEVSMPDDQKLIEELAAISYTLTSRGELKLVDIDSKDRIKKRLGRSPNRAEALIYALWGLQYAVQSNEETETQEADIAGSYV